MIMKLSVSALALTFSANLFAYAQDAAAEGEQEARTLGTVTVTAQKREQNVQDVPIAISAFGEEQLQELGVVDLSGLSQATPNVNLDNSSPFGGSQSILSAYIRGIGADDFAFNIDPGVGVYVDGVYLARSVGANQGLLDVQRIEVLKGPQGTLFGRNTIGGAISVVTADPSDTFGSKLDLTYGSDNLLQFRALVEGPLAENLTASLAVSSRTRDGYLERVRFGDPAAYNGTPSTEFPLTGYGSDDKEGAEDTQIIRGKLKWEGERATVRLTADYTKDQSTQASKLIQTTAGLPFPLPDGGQSAYVAGPFLDPNPTDGFDGFFFGGLYNFCLTQPAGAPAPISDLCGTRGQIGSSLQIDTPLNGNPNGLAFYSDRFVHPDIDKTYSDDPNFSDMETFGLTAQVDYDLTDNLAVKSITGYRDQTFLAGLDLDGSPLNILTVSFDQNQEQLSQEFQLLGSNLADNKLDFVLGAFYFKEEGDLQDLVLFPEGLLYVDGFNTFETKNYAVFGQFEYDLTDQFTVILGGRYTKEEKKFEGGQRDLNGGNYRGYFCVGANGYPDPSLPIAPFLPTGGLGLTCANGLLPAPYFDPDTFRVYEPGVQTQEFENFSPKIGLQYFPTDRVQLYASYSEGYKTGGWTTRLTNPIPAADTQYDEEIAETMELGVKTRLFNDRVQLNAAIFQTDYDDVQLNFQQGLSPTLQNAGTAEIRGFEADIEGILTDEISFRGSVGLLNTEFTAIDPLVTVASGPNPFQAGIVVGGELPKAPEVQVNFAPRYERNLGPGVFAVQGSFTYSSEAANQAERVFVLNRDEYVVSDLIFSYAFDNQPLVLTAGVKNIGDERFLVTGVPNTAAGVLSGTYNRGREWFLTLGYEF
ncbi:TonB-dependent receptor [Hyphomonas sp.]|uniref:TonB-dependent receptor n=1 Tax=Hyphomonas sp. TaxID=87 RepID=UPI0025BFC828|nr:TonB-dependent receptor [Hyphomonas sp.]